jgi:hypothetical protein
MRMPTASSGLNSPFSADVMALMTSTGSRLKAEPKSAARTIKVCVASAASLAPRPMLPSSAPMTVADWRAADSLAPMLVALDLKKASMLLADSPKTRPVALMASFRSDAAPIESLTSLPMPMAPMAAAAMPAAFLSPDPIDWPSLSDSPAACFCRGVKSPSTPRTAVPRRAGISSSGRGERVEEAGHAHAGAGRHGGVAGAGHPQGSGPGLRPVGARREHEQGVGQLDLARCQFVGVAPPPARRPAEGRVGGQVADERDECSHADGLRPEACGA